MTQDIILDIGEDIMHSSNGLFGLGSKALSLLSLGATAQPAIDRNLPRQNYPMGKGVRTTRSCYMPHHGKNVRYTTTPHGIIRSRCRT